MTTYTAYSALTDLEKAEKELPATHINTNNITFLSSQFIKVARYSQDAEDIQSLIERAVSMSGYRGTVQTAGELLRFEHLLIAVYRHRLMIEVEANQWLQTEAKPDTDVEFWEEHLGYSPIDNNCFTASELDMIRGRNNNLLANIYQYS